MNDKPELPLTIQDAVSYFRILIGKTIEWSAEQISFIPRSMRVLLALTLFPIWMFFVQVFAFRDFLL